MADSILKKRRHDLADVINTLRYCKMSLISNKIYENSHLRIFCDALQKKIVLLENELVFLQKVSPFDKNIYKNQEMLASSITICKKLLNLLAFQHDENIENLLAQVDEVIGNLEFYRKLLH